MITDRVAKREYYKFTIQNVPIKYKQFFIYYCNRIDLQYKMFLLN